MNYHHLGSDWGWGDSQQWISTTTRQVIIEEYAPPAPSTTSAPIRRTCPYCGAPFVARTTDATTLPNCSQCGAARLEA